MSNYFYMLIKNTQALTFYKLKLGENYGKNYLLKANVMSVICGF